MTRVCCPITGDSPGAAACWNESRFSFGWNENPFSFRVTLTSGGFECRKCIQARNWFRRLNPFRLLRAVIGSR
jgi:hypothetical protein